MTVAIVLRATIALKFCNRTIVILVHTLLFYRTWPPCFARRFPSLTGSVFLSRRSYRSDHRTSRSLAPEICRLGSILEGVLQQTRYRARGLFFFAPVHFCVLRFDGICCPRTAVGESSVGELNVCAGGAWHSENWQNSICLLKEWANSGLRATCGPQQRFQWPAEAFRKVFKSEPSSHSSQ